MPTTGIYVDDNVVVTIDATQFEEITSISLDKSVEMIETTSFDSNGDKTFTPGDRSYTLQIEAHFKADATQNFEQAIDDIKARASNAWLITSGVTGDTTYAGTGHVSSASISISKNSPSSCSITLQGTGGITKGTVA